MSFQVTEIQYYVTGKGGGIFPAHYFDNTVHTVHHTDPKKALDHAAELQKHVYDGKRDCGEFFIEQKVVITDTMEVPAYQPLNAWVLVRTKMSGGYQHQYYLVGERDTVYLEDAKKFETKEEAYIYKRAAQRHEFDNCLSDLSEYEPIEM